jgi:hypothetical protein
MITRLEVVGGWYGEALPSGEYAVAVPSQNKLVSHAGDIPFGPESPLFVRVTNAGGFKLAGQGQDTGRTVEWGGGFWNTKPVACGVSPVIYDSFGVLHISDCSIGSQGWRYVADDGTLVTGDQSFSSPVFHLYEFTTHGDITIGQGGDGGAIAVTPQGRFVLEPGYTVFIRYNRVGDRLAVTIVKLHEGKTVLLWLDAGDVATFPREAPAPVPVPKPVPVPVPAPEPKPMPVKTVPMPARIPAIVQALYAQHVDLAEGDDDQRRALQMLICEQARFELGPAYGAKKSAEGHPSSKDSIAYMAPDGVLYAADCFNGTTRKPAVPSAFDEIGGQVFIPVQSVDHLGAATGKPTQPAPDPGGMGTYGDFSAAAKGLEEVIRGLASMAFQQGAEINALKAKIAALEARPAGGNVTGIADGSTVALKSHDNGEYVTVEPGGDVNAKGPRAFGAYQLFTIEVQQ